MGREDLSTVGGRLRVMRLAKGLTQETVAKRLKTSQPAISQWEKDKWVPAGLMRARLADVLGTTEAWLFDGHTKTGKAA